MCSHVERCLCTRLITGCNILVLGTCLQDCTIFWFWNWLPEILRFLSLMGRRGTHWWRTSLPWVPWVSGGDPDPEIVYKMSCVWAYGDTGVIRVVTAEVLLHCKAPVPCSFLYSPLCFLCLFLEKAEWACTKEEMKLPAVCVDSKAVLCLPPPLTQAWQRRQKVRVNCQPRQVTQNPKPSLNPPWWLRTSWLPWWELKEAPLQGQRSSSVPWSDWHLGACGCHMELFRSLPILVSHLQIQGTIRGEDFWVSSCFLT